MSPHHWPRFFDTCCVFTLCVVRKRSVIWSTTQSWTFLAPECVVQVLRWSQSSSNWNFLQTHSESDPSAIIGIWSPTDVVKEVCQRPSVKDSSLRWVRIWSSQLIGLNHRSRLGVSSSCGSRSVISVRRTESSVIATTRWYTRRRNCSERHETTNVGLQSRKVVSVEESGVSTCAV